MIQLNAHHVWYLITAAQWTVLLSLIAFAGGVLVGLPLALMRVSPTAGRSIVEFAPISTSSSITTRPVCGIFNQRRSSSFA